MAAKVRALQEWCRRQCEGYRDVAVTNMTSSWKSGLAFCAIIHRYRPDLIDYDSLSKEDVFKNNKLAFDVALDELGIPALLDPEDMVMMAVPDKLCIITYVAQYYNYFHKYPQAGGPGVRSAIKRASREDDTAVHPTGAMVPPTAKKSAPSATAEQLVDNHVTDRSAVSHRGGTLDDRCHMCRGRVYLLERHYTAAGHLYHRHCYRGYQRSSSLQKSKQHSGKENADRPSVNGSELSSGPIGAGGLSTDAECVQSAARESRLPSSDGLSSAQGTKGTAGSTVTLSSAQGVRSTACTTVVSRHNPTTSSPSTGLIKALFTTPNYKQIATTAVSVTPVVSNINARTTSASSTSVPNASSSLARSDVITVSRATAAGGANVSKTVRRPSAFAAARSQYLERVGGLTAPAVCTSTAAVCLPTGTDGRKATSAVTLTLKASSSGTSSTLSQPSISCVASGRQYTTGGPSVTTTSYRTSTCSSLSNILTKTSETEVSTANTRVSSSSGAANYPFTGLITSSTTSPHSGGYVSPFREDRMLRVTVPTSSVRAGPVMSSATKSTAVTSQHQVAPTTALYTVGRPFTTPLMSTQQNGLEKNSVDSAGSQTIDEVTYLALRRRTESVVPSCSASTLSTGSRVTSRTGTATSSKTDWQLEAERRQAARHGAYIDPEKHRRDVNRQQLSRGQLPDTRESSYTPASVKARPNTLSKMHSPRDKMDATVADRMPLLRPTSRRLSSSDVTDVRLSSTEAPVSRQRRSKHLQNEMKFQQQDRFKSKKSDSSEPVMSVDEITRRLEVLDAALRVVESEGRDLEEKIRKDTDDAMDDDKDSRMVKWFALVKRRNELIREESDLMYRRRQQELEELHEELEYQLRPMLEKSDEQKTVKEKQDEERLLQELLEVVSLRNNIVDSIEVDRLRYIQEDQKIEDMFLESGLSTGKTDKAAMKGRKKKAHMSAKKDSVSSDTSKSKKKLFHFTSRSSLSMSAADRQNDVLPKHTSDFEVKI